MLRLDKMKRNKWIENFVKSNPKCKCVNSIVFTRPRKHTVAGEPHKMDGS